VVLLQVGALANDDDDEQGDTPSSSYPDYVIVIHTAKTRQDHGPVPLDLDPDTQAVLKHGHDTCFAGLQHDHKLFEEMHEQPPRALTVRHATASRSFLFALAVFPGLAPPCCIVGHDHAHAMLSVSLELYPRARHDLALRDR
jgi:hypothetical protein